MSYKWRVVESFTTMREAQKYLIDMNFSKKDRKVDVDKSVKTTYRCKVAKVKAKNTCRCLYRIYEPSTESNKFIVEHNRMEHNHHELNDEDKNIPTSTEMTKLIVDCSKKRMTAKRIIEHLEDLQTNYNIFVDENIPSQQHIYYLLRKNKEEETPPIISIGEMVEWCESHNEVPIDEDEPFVFAFEACGEKKQHVLQICCLN